MFVTYKSRDLLQSVRIPCVDHCKEISGSIKYGELRYSSTCLLRYVLFVIISILRYRLLLSKHVLLSEITFF